MVEAQPGNASPPETRRCILCGKPATHQAALLLVPSRGYEGRPWRVELTGAVVCAAAACQKPVPDELLGMMDQVRDSVGQMPFWEMFVRDCKAQRPDRAPPPRALARCGYEPLPSPAETTLHLAGADPGEAETMEVTFTRGGCIRATTRRPT